MTQQRLAVTKAKNGDQYISRGDPDITGTSPDGMRHSNACPVRCVRGSLDASTVIRWSDSPRRQFSEITLLLQLPQRENSASLITDRLQRRVVGRGTGRDHRVPGGRCQDQVSGRDADHVLRWASIC